MILKNWKGFLTLSFVGLLLLASCNEREQDGFAGYDTNDFADWDEDEDERLDENEFRNVYNETGYYGVWDANADRGVDEEEWGTALNAKRGPEYDEGEYGDFDAWDADADGVLNETELGAGVFTYYDTNRDNYLVEEEYGPWRSGLDYQKTEDISPD